MDSVRVLGESVFRSESEWRAHAPSHGATGPAREVRGAGVQGVAGEAPATAPEAGALPRRRGRCALGGVGSGGRGARHRTRGGCAPRTEGRVRSRRGRTWRARRPPAHPRRVRSPDGEDGALSEGSGVAGEAPATAPEAGALPSLEGGCGLRTGRRVRSPGRVMAVSVGTRASWSHRDWRRAGTEGRAPDAGAGRAGAGP